MKKTNKKGFTIVELVIVIAVIAILSAVLIPTFSGIVKKARLSADQQAVRQMNTALATYDDVDTYPEAIAALAEDNIDMEDYKPLSKNHYFYFAMIDNKPTVVLADKNDKVIYPKDVTLPELYFSLSGSTPTNDNYSVENGVATIDDGAKLAHLIQSVKDNTKAVSAITLSDDANLHGANVDFGKISDNLTIDGANNAIIGARSDNNVVVGGGDFEGDSYGFGFIGEIPAGKTVTIKNVTLDGLFSGSTIAGHDEGANTTGLIAGYVKGNLVLENVTIKNSTAYGHQKVGAICGQLLGGTITLRNVTFENVNVSGAMEVAKVAGIMNSNASIVIENTSLEGITTVGLEQNVFSASDIVADSELSTALNSSSLSFSSNSKYSVSAGWIFGVVTNDLAWYAPSAYNKDSDLYKLMYKEKHATYNGSNFDFSSYPFTYANN